MGKLIATICGISIFSGIAGFAGGLLIGGVGGMIAGAGGVMSTIAAAVQAELPDEPAAE